MLNPHYRSIETAKIIAYKEKRIKLALSLSIIILRASLLTTRLRAVVLLLPDDGRMLSEKNASAGRLQIIVLKLEAVNRLAAPGRLC